MLRLNPTDIRRCPMRCRRRDENCDLLPDQRQLLVGTSALMRRSVSRQLRTHSWLLGLQAPGTERTRHQTAPATARWSSRDNTVFVAGEIQFGRGFCIWTLSVLRLASLRLLLRAIRDLHCCISRQQTVVTRRPLVVPAWPKGMPATTTRACCDQSGLYPQ